MAKHGNSVSKLGILLILFAFGALLGGAASDVFFTPLVAQPPVCEYNECDDGWFGGSCEHNEHGATGCIKTPKDNWFDGCQTYACGKTGN